MGELLLKLLLSAALTLLKGGAAVAGHSIGWWLAAVLGLGLVFGAWFFLLESDGAAG